VKLIAALRKINEAVGLSFGADRPAMFANISLSSLCAIPLLVLSYVFAAGNNHPDKWCELTSSRPFLRQCMAGITNDLLTG